MRLVHLFPRVPLLSVTPMIRSKKGRPGAGRPVSRRGRAPRYPMHRCCRTMLLPAMVCPMANGMGEC